MSVVSRLLAPFRGIVRRDAAGSGGSVAKRFVQGVLSGTMPAPKEIPDFLAAYSTMPWLRAPIEKIAFRFGAVKWAVFGTRGDTGKYVRMQDVQYGSMEYRRKALTGLVEQGRAQRFDEHPLLEMLAPQRALWQTYLDIIGDSFWLWVRNPEEVEVSPKAGLGPPVGMLPIPPHWIKRFPTPGRPTFEIKEQQLNLTDVPMTEVLWDKILDPANPYGRGTGIMRTLADELDAHENASKLVNYQFYNLGRPDMLISIEGFDDDQLKAFAQSWRASLQGIVNFSRTHFVNQKISAQKINQDFVHMQLVDLQKAMRDTVRQVPGLPPEIMGITESSNRATITAARNIMNEEVLVPRLEHHREFVQKHVIPMWDERLVLDYESPSEKDRDFSLQALQNGTPARVDEWRNLAGLDPVGGSEGKLWIVSSTSKLVTSLQDYADQEAAPPPTGEEGAPPTPGVTPPQLKPHLAKKPPPGKKPAPEGEPGEVPAAGEPEAAAEGKALAALIARQTRVKRARRLYSALTS